MALSVKDYVPGDDGAFDADILASERKIVDARRARIGVGPVVADDGSADLPDIRNAPRQPGANAEPAAYRGHGTVGLALSGGGIRSATFCLGILQFLAAKGLLKHVDYLSTVSGGGYIGAALTWFVQAPDAHGFTAPGGKPFGVHDDNFPFGTQSPKRNEPMAPHPRLDFLRSKGKYLTPGKGMTLAAGASVVLRGLLLNQIVLIPICVVVALLLYLITHGLLVELAHYKPAWSSLGDAGKLVVAKCDLLDYHRQSCADVGPPLRSLVAFLIPTVAMLGLFVVACALYSLTTRQSSANNAQRYRWRRCIEIVGGYWLTVALAFAVIGSLPLTDMALSKYITSVGGIWMFLGGVASGLWTYAKSASHNDEKSAIPIGVVAPIAAVLFIYGFALLVFQIAGAMLILIHSPHTVLACAGLTVALLIALVTGWWVDVNLISLHRFYRDRLMEAFLPNVKPGAAPQAEELASKADVGFLNAMADRDVDPPAGAADPARAQLGPYHLVGTNLITVDSNDPTRRLRGGESFLMSPLFCGSKATGWIATDKFVGGEMSLATAMAISGAAANPSAGGGGAGPTRNRVVSAVMTMLNIRLGYWVPNPNPDWKRCAGSPNHFTPAALYLLPGLGLREDRGWVQLSDGGHFDNSGMYELFRRRVKLIIACDGSADPMSNFADLQIAMDYAYRDFGVCWTSNTSKLIEALVPSKVLGYPGGQKRSDRGFMVAGFTYPDKTSGLLIYMTTTLIDQLGLSVLGYRADNAEFPDQPTADQFFDEHQFEAYRELGWCVAEEMAGHTGIASTPNAAGKPYLVVPRAT